LQLIIFDYFVENYIGSDITGQMLCIKDVFEDSPKTIHNIKITFAVYIGQ
jgi:hypothetical protein